MCIGIYLRHSINVNASLGFVKVCRPRILGRQEESGCIGIDLVKACNLGISPLPLSSRRQLRGKHGNLVSWQDLSVASGSNRTVRQFMSGVPSKVEFMVECGSMDEKSRAVHEGTGICSIGTELLKKQGVQVEHVCFACARPAQKNEWRKCRACS